MKLNAVIIDDENKAREILRILLEKHCPDVTIAGEAENAEQGRALLQKIKPDILFLDIQMPDETGIEFLKKQDSIAFDVIFVTSFDQYAIEALRLNALDYLLKPVSPNDLETAVKKAEKRKMAGKSETEKLLKFIHTAERASEDHFIPAHLGGAVHLVRINEIEYVQGASNYIDVSTARSTYTISKTMQEFEEMVKNKGSFVRISKSGLLNILQIALYFKTEPCIIRMKSGKEFEVSRRKKTEVMEVLRRYNIMSGN